MTLAQPLGMKTEAVDAPLPVSLAVPSDGPAAAVHAVVALSLDDLLTGNWEEALRVADTGLAVCESRGFQEFRWPLWFVSAFIAALRGYHDEALLLAGDIETWGNRRGSAAVRLYACYVRCLAAQARGDFDEAYREISVLAVPATFTANLPLALGASFDFVECAVRTGHQAAARDYVARTRTVQAVEISPRVSLLTECAAALADPQGAELLERALVNPAINSWPYDKARVQLAYAERLRRAGWLLNSRKHLTAAHATFVNLRAEPWVSRTCRELRAGAPSPSDTTAAYGQALTAQEREIADLAATGLTNKQIAAKVYLSHRTVGAHLYRIFPKLGITTRAALRDALSDT